MSRPQRRWTAEEDSHLQREVDAQMTANDGSVHDWNSIAQKIQGRSNKDCRKRFYNGMVDGLRKGPWTSEEDQMLLSLVNKHGTAWAVVAPEIGTRSADQCSKRWQHCLNPDLNRSPWTSQENMQLLIAVRTHGTAWKDIQTLHLPSRSANNVKNQYSVLKKQNIQVPPNAPLCCAAISSSNRAESSRTASHKSGIQDDGEDLLEQFNKDNISNTNTIHSRSNDADQLYSLSPIRSIDPLYSFEKDILSNDSDVNLFDQDFVFDNLDFGSAIEPTHHYDLDSNYNMQLDDTIINQPPYTSNIQPPPTGSTSHFIAKQNNNTNGKEQAPAQLPPYHRSHHHRLSGTQWLPPFLDTDASARKPALHRQQQQNPQQQTPPAPTPTETSANPPAPNWQTIIRFSEADPTTVSTVIGVLANSQAKFIYETG